MKNSKIILLISLTILLLFAMPFVAGAATNTDKRGYVAGKNALELNGVMVGWLWSAEGGNASAAVIPEKVGADGIQKKHLGQLKYEDITVTCGAGMFKEFYQWLKDAFEKKNPRKNGAIIQADYNGKEVSRLNFTNAMISQISFPASDAASKDAAKMSVTITPEYTQQMMGSGKTLTQISLVEQKKWLPANFRLTIAGLDTTKVNKVDALVFKQAAVTKAKAPQDSTKNPIQQEIPNLVITFPESHAQTFQTWYGDFVIKGNNGDGAEKNGTLEYLTPNLQTLFKLTFRNIGIFRLTPEKVEAGSENIRRLKAEMYVEDMVFDYMTK